MTVNDPNYESDELPSQDQMNTENSEQHATIGDIDDLANQIDGVMSAINHLSSQFSALLNLTRTNTVLNSVSEEDVADMGTILSTQRAIIQTMLTSDSFDVNVRKSIGAELMAMPEWADMDQARKNLQQRQKQRQLIATSHIESNQPSDQQYDDYDDGSEPLPPPLPKRPQAKSRNANANVNGNRPRPAQQQFVPAPQQPQRPSPQRIPNQPMRRPD